MKTLRTLAPALSLGAALAFGAGVGIAKPEPSENPVPGEFQDADPGALSRNTPAERSDNCRDRHAHPEWSRPHPQARRGDAGPERITPRDRLLRPRPRANRGPERHPERATERGTEPGLRYNLHHQTQGDSSHAYN